MGKALAICIVLGSLFGCSSTTVHLHANGLTETERENVRAGLEKQGFSVKIRDNEPPSDGITILYYPDNGIEADLLAVDQVLETNGLKAGRPYARHTEKLGKHEYTAGNIGVYIAGAGRQDNASNKSRIRSVFPMTMTDYEFVSVNCEREYLYEFFDDGTLVVSDLTLPIDETTIATASWQAVSDDTVVISHDREELSYNKAESHFEHSSEHSHYVVTYRIKLQPIGYYRVPFGCDYTSTFFEAF